MENIEWAYFFLTTKQNVKQFEHERSILRKKEFTKEAHDIILKLKTADANEDLDMNFISWMTKDSIPFETTRQISKGAQEFCIEHKSFDYLHSLLGNLFSYHNFFPQHQKYCFIKHGYPIGFNIELANYREYIVFKNHEEIYETIKISNRKCINEIVKKIKSSNLLFNIGDIKIDEYNVLFLQHSDYLDHFIE